MPYVYVGNGEYVGGVPTTTLTDAEWAALSPEDKLACRDLYKHVSVAEAEKLAAPKPTQLPAKPKPAPTEEA